MPTKTTNYGLVKPASEEYYNVEIQNTNMDIIDTQIKADTDNISALNTSLSNTIKKDGSVQMTGVLKAKGGSSIGPVKGIEQIVMGKFSILTDDDALKLVIADNCYSNGSNWKYLSDGMASSIHIDLFDTTKPIRCFYAAVGVKDAAITWIENSPLGIQGGTLLAGLNISMTNNIPFVDLKADNGGNRHAIIAMNGNTSITEKYRGLQLINRSLSSLESTLLQMYPQAIGVKDLLHLYTTDGSDNTTGDYKIYGEHNITCSSTAPITTLAEGAQHQVYA